MKEVCKYAQYILPQSRRDGYLVESGRKMVLLQDSARK